MKKILFVSTGDILPKGALDFLRSLENVEITALLFCPLDYDLVASASHVPIASPYLRIREKEKQNLNLVKERFANECREHHLRFHIHENDERWDKDLFTRLSRFADLVVLSGERFCEDGDDRQPNSYLQQALHASECPVMILPEHYSPAEHLVIAYDGSRDSLFAIRQFTYLFPQLTEKPTEIVYAKNEGSNDIPDIESLKQYIRLHFGSIGFSKLHFNPCDYFSTWIGERRPTMLIAGSYGRSAFSYTAKRSFVSRAIADHKVPVFIAHT